MRVHVCKQNVTLLSKTPDFLSPIITYEEPWIRHYNPESKQQSCALKEKRSIPPKKFRSVPRSGNYCLFVFTSTALLFRQGTS
jgi:hypothetical protein